MRKYSIFALASVAALSLSVSCSKEKDVLAPETEKITITASFPEVTSVDLELTKLNPPMGADCEGATVEVHFNNY